MAFPVQFQRPQQNTWNTVDKAEAGVKTPGSTEPALFKGAASKSGPTTPMGPGKKKKFKQNPAGPNPFFGE